MLRHKYTIKLVTTPIPTKWQLFCFFDNLFYTCVNFGLAANEICLFDGQQYRQSTTLYTTKA